MRKICIGFLLVFCLFSNGYSQVNCWEALKQANNLFEQGDYTSCVQLLNNYLKSCDPSDKEIEDVYVLLTQAYLEQDNIKEAENSALLLLKENPNYRLKGGTQTEDFNSLIKKFRIVPLFSIGAKAGYNIPYYRSTRVFSILDSVDYGVPYIPKTSFQMGLRLDVEPVKNLSVTAEFEYVNSAYVRHLAQPHDWQLTYTENNLFLNFPFYITKYFNIKKENLKPYFYAGGAICNLNRSSGSIELNYTAVDVQTKEKDMYLLIKNQIDQKALRNVTTYSGLIGSGVRYKRNNALFYFDVRYSMGLNNLMDPNRRYRNGEMIFLYNYIDNNYVLNSLAFTFGYSYIFKYNIRKKDEGR